MNAEKLNTVLVEIIRYFDKLDFVNKIVNIETHYLRSNYPVDQMLAFMFDDKIAETDTRVAALLQQNLDPILQSLTDSSNSYFIPQSAKIIQAIGGEDLLGTRLADKIMSTFIHAYNSQNYKFTQLDDLILQVKNFYETVQIAHKGLLAIGIGQEEVETNICELAYFMPRKIVNDSLDALGKEVSDLKFVLSALNEVILGKREEIVVKSIASSDFTYYLEVTIAVAIALNKCIEKILGHYKTVLEIRKLHQELQAKGLPNDHLEGIKEHADLLMLEGKSKLAEDILANNYNGSDDGRKNELVNGLKIAVDKLSEKLLQGFSFEFKFKMIEQKSDSSTNEKAKIELIKSIHDTNLQGKSIEILKKTIHKLEAQNNKKAL